MWPEKSHDKVREEIETTHRHRMRRPVGSRGLRIVFCACLCVGVLAGCASAVTSAGAGDGESVISNGKDLDTDPIDLVPVARFMTPIAVDDIARCIGERWARLSVIATGKVTLHPSLRGLIVDVKASGDPLARSYVEVYPVRGATRVDYFVRSFVSDPDEDLRLRALQSCF